jgi:hypothetical protein
MGSEAVEAGTEDPIKKHQDDQRSSREAAGGQCRGPQEEVSGTQPDDLEC